MGLNSKYSTSVATPAEKAALGKDVDGPPASGHVNYASKIGTLLYLGHIHPDIAFATHQCACQTFAPIQFHEDALNHIGRYLKGTLTNGLILTPSNELKIDCYPDADFDGEWNQDNKSNPHCVHSRTGHVICLFNCPVLWISKLQAEIALSTMAAKYVVLSTLRHDLFPLINITKEICLALLLTPPNTAQMHIKIHKDNGSTPILGQPEPKQMTPHSKHHAVKYYCFCKHLVTQKIQLVKITTTDQLGDLFTKGLEKVVFE